jgi:hypothetical protein
MHPKLESSTGKKYKSKTIPVKSDNFEPMYIHKYKVFCLETKKGEG